MGGSGIVGEFFSTIFKGEPLLQIIKSFDIQNYVSKKTLAIAVSYSGETLETLTCTQKAIEHGARVYAITNKKSTLAKIVGLEKVIPVTPGLLPRTDLPEMLGSLLGLILGDKYQNEIAEISLALKDQQILEKGKEIAHFINKDGLPVISICGKLSPIATRWAQELAENSKIPSMVRIYPEAAHNFIVGWEKAPKLPYRFLLLKYNKKGICYSIEEMLCNIYKKVASAKFYQLDFRDLSDSNELRILLISSLIAGYTSVYLAKLKNVDPIKTENINFYKSQVVSKFKKELLRRLKIA